MSLIDIELARRYRECSDDVLRREYLEAKWRFKKHMFFGTMSGIGSLGSITITFVTGGIVAAATVPTGILAAATAADNFSDADDIRRKIEAMEFIMEERSVSDTTSNIEIELQNISSKSQAETDGSTRFRRINT